MTPTATPDHLNIGICCFPTFGGSGIIATEVGLAMARRGHHVHFVCLDVPQRLDRRADNVTFHQVEARDYPLLPQAPYAIALASRLVELATFGHLDVVHVHYAVPHAVSAFLAGQVLAERAPRVVTTLHGTDITLLASDPGYRPIVRFAIQHSDAVTTPSEFLRRDTAERLDLPIEGLEVVANFVDTERYRPPEARDPDVVSRLFEPDMTGASMGAEALNVVHVSNFRPVKRVMDVADAFAEVARRVPARLVMIGDGPDRPAAEQRLRDAGVHDRAVFLGKQHSFVDVLQHCDVFLLPSEAESFGVAALEAQSCGLPVVASNVGGVPEVIEHGVTGLLAPVGEVAAFTEAVLALAADPERRRQMGEAARERAVSRFSADALTDRYESVYRRVLAT